MSNLQARFELPALPFERHSLEPELSRAQIDLLYSHYHRQQLDALNLCLSATDRRSLSELSLHADRQIALPAGEAWNLVLFWHGLAAKPEAASSALAGRIGQSFGSWSALKTRWWDQIERQRPDWSWLVKKDDNRLGLAISERGKIPVGATPLMAIALCADARCIDYGEDLGAYFEAVWQHLNWQTVALQLDLQFDS